jgi:branched-chain amino acid transport system permease protein
VVFTKVGLSLGLAAGAAVLCVMAVGVLTERLTIRPARHAPEVSLIIITIGTSIAIRGLALLFWGTSSYSLTEFSPGAPFNIWGAVLSRQRVWIMAAAAVVLALLYLFFEFTLLGKAVRACAVNRLAAETMGISTTSMSALSYALSAGMGAIGGIVIAPLTLVSYDMGLALGLKGFVVAIMGGLVSAPAAVVGGLLLGVLESLASGLLSSGIKDAVAFLILFLVLLARTMQGERFFRRRP